MALSRVVVMSAVDDMVEIAVFAPHWLFDLTIGDLQIPNPPLPRFGEHGGIIRRHSVLQLVPTTMQALHDSQVLRVERAVVDEPRFIVEVDGFHNERVVFPLPDRIAQVATPKRRWP